MVPAEQIAQLPFFQGMPAWALREFAEAATDRLFAARETLLRQQDEAQSVYFLLSGSVQIFVRFEGADDLLVGSTSGFGALLGWSAFRPPYRYTSSIRCEEPSGLLRLPREVFTRVFDRDPRLGYTVLRRISTVLANRLEQTRDMLAKTPPKLPV